MDDDRSPDSSALTGPARRRVRLHVTVEADVDEAALREHLARTNTAPAGPHGAWPVLGDAAAMVLHVAESGPQPLPVTSGVSVVGRQVRAEIVSSGGASGTPACAEGVGDDPAFDAALGLPDAAAAPRDRGWGPVFRRLARGLTTWD